MKKVRRARGRSRSKQPVMILSNTVDLIKSTHFKKDEALQKTMTKLDMDKVILLREKISSIDNEELF